MNRLNHWLHRAQAAGLALLFAAGAAPALAGTATGTIASSVTLTGDCTLTTHAMPFGRVDSLSSSSASLSINFSVACSSGTPAVLALNAGSTTGGTTAVRMMTDGNGHTVNYSLYQDSGLTTLWGSTAGTDTKAIVGTGSSVLVPVYGHILAGQVPLPGIYVDTVTATLSY